MKRKVAIRADGNAVIGLGHIYRCLALIDILKKDFHCHFFIRNPTLSIKTLIASNSKDITVLPETDDDDSEARIMAQLFLTDFHILVLDGYHFRSEYQRIVKKSGVKLICIDDIYQSHFYADIVINHAGGIIPSYYNTEAYTKLYLGPQYALLRGQFLNSRFNRDERKNLMNVLLCMGGADPKNDTVSVLKQLAAAPIFYNHIHIIVGAGYVHHEELALFLLNKSNYTLQSNLQAAEMIYAMENCGIAILPASTISYEYMSLGGVVFLKKIAENQKDIYNYFINEKMAYPSEFAGRSINEENLSALLSKQKAVLDRKSGERITNIFKEISK